MFTVLEKFLPWRKSLRVTQRSTDLAAQWLRADDESPPATLTNAFAQSTWIYACVSAISQQVAHTPFRFSIDEPASRAQRTDEQPLQSGPLVELFNRPHPQLDRFLFWELIVSWLLLRGQAFVVGLDALGKVVAVNPARALPAHLMVLNADRLTKIVSEHQLLGYRYQPAKADLLGPQELLPEEVISLRLANPFDCCEGQSTAAVASLAAETDYAAAQFMKGLMLSNADTGLLVTVEHEPSVEQRSQILAALRERRRKVGTADRPLFLWAGAKIEKPSISMVDIEFLENRKFSRQEICAIYKTPQEILGFTEDSNRAVAEAARLNWIENTIALLCERLAAAFTPLLSGHSTLHSQPSTLFFDIESLPAMQKARRERFRAARQGFEMGVPVSVLNQLFDLGLPALPHDDVSFLPGSFQPVAGLGSNLIGGTSYASPRPSLANIILPEGNGTRVARPSSIALSSGDSPRQVALRSRLSRFFFEQRGRALARCSAGALPLLDLEAENERLRAATRSFADEGVTEEHVSDINETTIQQLAEELQHSEGADVRAASVRRVFQAAARERAPMLARLLVNRNQQQPITTH